MATNTFNLATWYHIKDIVYIITICVLIFAHVRFLIKIIRVTHDTISMESRGVRHDHKVIQIHQEAEEVKERLSEDFIRVISFWSMK